MKTFLSLLLLIPFLASSQNLFNEGLIAGYKMNGNANEMNSLHSGILNNVISCPDRFGRNDSALYFNGLDAFIEVADADEFTFSNNIFSFCVWIYTEDTINKRAILSKRTPTGAFEYSLDNGMGKNNWVLDNWTLSGCCSVYGPDPLQARAPVPIGEWQHLVYVADGHSLKVYANGVLQNNQDSYVEPNFFGNGDAPFCLGKGGAYGVNHFFKGKMDEVYIFNRVLNEEEILYLYNYNPDNPDQTFDPEKVMIQNTLAREILIVNPGLHREDIHLNLFDISGKMISVYTISAYRSFDIQLDVETFAAGMCFIRIESENKIAVRKWIKM